MCATTNKNEFMQEAIRLSIENVTSGKGGPFGAVIVKDGKIIHSKGYGVKSILTKEKVDQIIADCRDNKITLHDK